MALKNKRWKSVLREKGEHSYSYPNCLVVHMEYVTRLASVVLKGMGGAFWTENTSQLFTQFATLNFIGCVIEIFTENTYIIYIYK